MTKRLLVTMVVMLTLGAVLVSDRTQAQKVVTSSCPEPVVGVESVQIVDASCGVENTCVKIKWNVKSNGATITGFKVDLTATPTAPPTTPQDRSVEVNGNTRETTIGIFTSVLQGGPFKAQVTAKYQGCAIAFKSGTF
jgi:hypothetical protein